MLHILLLILKIIGIILAVLLGIIILLLTIILFVPIRYEISAKCDGEIETLKAKAKAAWLMRLLCAEGFVKGKMVKWQLRAAWVKKSGAMMLGGRKEDSDVETKETKSEETPQKAEDAVVDVKSTEKTAEVCEKEFEKNKENDEGVRLESNLEEDEEKLEEKSEVKQSFIVKLREKIEKIKGSIDKINDLLTDKSHVRAFKKLKKELFVLLKRLKPKKIKVKLRFGFDDPGMTGKVLGGISMLYPVFEDSLEIVPDFQKQILKGNVYIKGRIRLCHIASLALKLILCKDIRTSYKDIKNFEL